MTRKSMLHTMKCKRGCGRMLVSLIAPIHSTKETQAQFAGICANCMTDDEKNNLLSSMTHDVSIKFARG